MVSASDMAGLFTKLPRLKDETVVCSSAAELPLLARAASVFFVVSEISMCSTAFQQLVLDALQIVEPSRCKLFRLDEARIPVGLQALRSLTEDLPT